jgi:hypothetical protein
MGTFADDTVILSINIDPAICEYDKLNNLILFSIVPRKSK